MAGKNSTLRRSHEEIQRDRTKISYLLLQGLKLPAIADLLGTSVTLVTREVAAIEQEWLTERVLNVTALRNRELHRLAHLEMRTWAAFERSGEPLKVTRTRTRSGERKKKGDSPAEEVPPDGMPHIGPDVLPGPEEVSTVTDNEATVRIEEKNPDPRYLMVIERIIEQRIRLLGLETKLPDDDVSAAEPIREVTIFVTSDFDPHEPDPRHNGHATDTGDASGAVQADVIDVLPRLNPPTPPADEAEDALELELDLF